MRRARTTTPSVPCGPRESAAPRPGVAARAVLPSGAAGRARAEGPGGSCGVLACSGDPVAPFVRSRGLGEAGAAP